MRYKHGCTERDKRNSQHPEWRSYCAWLNMHRRCKRTDLKDYPNYGGRGIRVCPEWEDFTAFYHDMGSPPIGGSLDRIDNNGNYEPGNCQWTTKRAQARNRRSNRILEHNGKSMSVTEWAEHLGLPRQRIKNRLHRGWSIERVLSVENFEDKGRFGEHKKRGRDF